MQGQLKVISFQTFQSCSNRWSSSVRLKHFKTVSGRTGPGCCQQRFCLEWLDIFSVSRHHVVLALSEKHCTVYASESRQRRKPLCKWMRLVMHGMLTCLRTVTCGSVYSERFTISQITSTSLWVVHFIPQRTSQVLYYINEISVHSKKMEIVCFPQARFHG